ncbi:ROK family protein [Faecalibaculum rodentium]|jgi:predicted NBD/HSP70 family sugar kinase|uniref:ROK family protein n=1 Tax=Faecalibaculum rodentium TaxID=1702221 RepID=UPI0020811DFF|nr:ROK family protein [Faecalibaculum rodentium]GJM56798.1 hypothetical protein EROP_04910 [Erysipelotrichaceae bacterium OPF54]
MKAYACIDIGGTAVKYGVLDQKLNIIGKWETPSRAAEGKEALVKQIREIAAFLFEQGQTICGIAISSAGVVDSERACILHANESIPGYTGTDWKEELACFGVPVEADNDVNCAGLCEYETGAGQGSRSMLMVTIGTGIGGCFVENGHLMHGHSSSACEIGYIPVDGMQFQHQASTTALVRDVAALKKEDPDQWNGRRIFELAEEGDPDCIGAIERLCASIAKGVAAVCFVLNPETVVLGGGIMAQEKKLRKPIEMYFEQYTIPLIARNTRIEFAKSRNDAGMKGALLHFLKRQGR